MITASELKELEHLEEELAEEGPCSSAPAAQPEMVEFCGQMFSATSLMDVSSVGPKSVDLSEFCELVRDLDTNANIALKLHHKAARPVFVAFGRADRFYMALFRLCGLTAWQMDISHSRINPGKGFDVTVVLP